ncbi:hypothetical protein [Nocardioides caldifontis]|uniref:hypothetical protein n=1 Tax=Nocardioides caldifontis TaxID=2588938 RepID=UPI0011E05044|nr:hypothetical protein [Nocardioides caldifontis]
MTTETVTPPPAAAAAPRSGALSVRRWFLVASPVLAGLFAVVGAYADPAVGLDGKELFRLYADNPGPLQWKSLGFHWSYAFWMAPALLVAPYVRGRGAWFANVTAFVGFAGMTTLPGLLFSDWYDSAIGQSFGAEGVEQVQQTMEGMWGVPVFTMPGMIGLMLSLPLAALTLWRAGRAPAWGLVAAVAAFVAFAVSGITWWGCAIATVFLAVVSIALHRATAEEPAAWNR